VLNIRRSTPDDVAACVSIVRELPDYFTDDVPNKVMADFGAHQGWIATEAGRLVGFAIVDRRSRRSAEILWIAVRRAAHGSGVGTALVNHLLNELTGDGLQLVEAKTLDHTANYQPYVATRAFWERRGFVQVDTIDPLPGWRAGNPAAIYVAALASTR
jgi:GNAT superfamily N-acetyltransferase